MEALILTLHIESKHTVTHFKTDDFTLYECAMIFGRSVEESVKMIASGQQHTTNF